MENLGHKGPKGAGTLASVKRSGTGTGLVPALLRADADLHRGFGDALSQAFELVFTPAIFGFGGHLLDRRLGTTPLFTLVLFLLVTACLSWKMLARYNERMRAEESLLWRGAARGTQVRGRQATQAANEEAPGAQTASLTGRDFAGKTSLPPENRDPAEGGRALGAS